MLSSTVNDAQTASIEAGMRAFEKDFPTGLPIRVFLYGSSYTGLPIRFFLYGSSYTVLPIRVFLYGSSYTGLPTGLPAGLPASLPIRVFLYGCSYTGVPIRVFLATGISTGLPTSLPIRIFLYGCSYTGVPIRVFLYGSSYTNLPIRVFLRVFLPVFLRVFLYGRSYTGVPIRVFLYGSSYGSSYESSYKGLSIRVFLYGSSYTGVPIRVFLYGSSYTDLPTGKEYNFDKYSHGQLDSLGAQYDYDSIMHYGKYGFSRNGKQTLVAIDNPSRELGQRDGLSAGDILKLNVLYDCSSKFSEEEAPTGGWSSWSSFSRCDDACSKYRQRFCTAEDRETTCPGADQYGIETEHKTCSSVECYVPVDGHWGRWSSWSTCSVSCDRGKHTRTRKCDDPPTKNNGKYCIGRETQVQDCLIQSCGVGSDDCHFDDDQWCHWKIDVGSSPLPWFRGTQGTPTSHTGPEGDHTSGAGGFLYTESSSPVTPGHTTRLISKEFVNNSTRCMIFFYSMYGDGMGTLNVYIKQTGTMVKVWDKSGNQGNQWHRGYVTITTKDKHQIVFESIRGHYYRSDIGLDDVTFTNGSCVVAMTTPPATTLPITTPTPQPRKSPFVSAGTDPESFLGGVHHLLGGADYCDFGITSGTYCTWYNDPKNSRTADYLYRYTWRIHYGATPSRRTGPEGDHSNR
ncbi:hypothetical protein QZH41_013230, partial [Actinostola sp. cb2023]